MGMHSDILELYARSNMIVLAVRLNSRAKDRSVSASVNILADFNNTIDDVVKCASQFWELDEASYQLIDEKSVTMPRVMKIKDIYWHKGNVHKISVELVNRYKTQFEILKSHLKSAETDGQTSGTGQTNATGRRVFTKDIRIHTVNENQLENAPQRFFKK